MLNETDEKRKYKRVNSTIPLQYKKLRQLSEGTVGAITQNVGEGGVRFIANEFLPLASRLVVEVFLPAQPRPIKAISKVAWIRKIPAADQYEVGNQFLEVGKEDKVNLSQYISKLHTSTF
ncbi:MAG: PilZ domain-containing protein [Candidatus Omnitrophica bacterium]|nr:PilZ domain-containing protein [Candidatus Omnitrophota bacterium]